MFSYRHGIVIFFLTTFLFGCFEQKSTSELIMDAKQQFADKQFSVAEITLKKIIKADPQLAQARVLLAEIYLASERFDFAEKEFLKALDINPGNDEIALKLTEVFLKIGKDQEAIDVLSKISFIDESSKLLSLILKGKAYVNLGERASAKEAFDEAISLNESDSYSLYGSALKATMEKNFDLASSFLDSTLKKDSGLAEAWILKARIAESTEDYLTANQAYTEFLKVKPEAHSIKLYMANNFLLLDDLTNSEVLADEFLAVNPNQLTANLLKARIALERKNYTLVHEHAERALKVFPNNPLALYLSGLSHYFNKSYDQAYDKLLQVTSFVSEDHPSHRFLMLTMLNLGQIERLSEALTEFEGFYPYESETLSEFASKLSLMGKSDISLALLEKALSIQPNNLQVKTKLGILKLIRKDAQGLEDLRLASAESVDDSAANFALTTAYLIKNEPEKAKQTIDKWLKKHPENIEALLLKAKVLQALRMPREAVDILNKANKLKPDQADVIFELAQQQFLLKEYKLAEKLVKNVIELEAGVKRAYSLLFNIKLAMDEKTLFIEDLREVAAKKPTLQWPRVILAQQALIKRNPQQALAWLSSLEKLNGLSSDYFITLLNSYFLMGDKNKLNKAALRWQKLSPLNIQSYSVQIELLEKLKDFKQALIVTQKAREQDNLKDDTMLVLSEVQYAIYLGKTDGLDTLVAEMIQNLPSNAKALYLSGVHALMNKHFSTAKRELEASYRHSKTPKTTLLLAKTYRDIDNTNAAIEFLEQTPASLKNHVLIQKYLAELYMRGNPSQAERLYIALIKKEPNNAVILNNLAVLSTNNGNVEDAIKFAKKAQELSPHHPEILDTLGVALIHSKQYGHAVEVLQQAYDLDKSADITRHFAQAMTLNDQRDSVSKILADFSAEERKRFDDELTKFNAM